MKLQTRKYLMAALLGAGLLSGCAPLVVGGAVMTGVVAVARRPPGTQRYVWGLERRTAKALPASQAYPIPAAGRAAPKYGRRALAA